MGGHRKPPGATLEPGEIPDPSLHVVDVLAEKLPQPGPPQAFREEVAQEEGIAKEELVLGILPEGRRRAEPFAERRFTRWRDVADLSTGQACLGNDLVSDEPRSLQIPQNPVKTSFVQSRTASPERNQTLPQLIAMAWPLQQPAENQTRNTHGALRSIG